MFLLDTKSTRDLILLSVSSVYLIAFSSLYSQIPGLYGDNGILPVNINVPKEPKSFDEWINSEDGPTLLSFAPHFGLEYQSGMDLICLLGMTVSFGCILFSTMRDCLSFFILWILYFSLYRVGQTFLWFQWDILLLEVGFLCFVIAPMQWKIGKWSTAESYPHDHITIWLIKWLLFRLMFMSGAVKLTSGCPAWWSLTALDWHYESQCIPTSLAWFAHQLPQWFQKLSVVATLVIEIAVPLLFFLPMRNIQFFCFCSQLLLQLLIISSGNYNFFNLLTIAMCFSLVDGGRRVSASNSQKKSVLSGLVTFVSSLGIYFALFHFTILHFNLTLNSDWSVSSNIVFTKEQFSRFLSSAVPFSIYLAATSLLIQVLKTFYISLFQMNGLVKKVTRTLGTAFFTIIALFLFTISLVPYSSLHKETQSALPQKARQLYGQLAPYHLVNSYGLFRHMTGVGGRPELILEASEKSVNGPWQEYHFLYKPGDVNVAPSFVLPHQPRVDWQMWFAALGNYESNPWLLNMVYRLLQGQPEVMQLLDQRKLPFEGRTPRFIRGKLFTYHYTKWDDWRRGVKQWWRRENKQDYLFPLSLDHSGLLDFLRSKGIVGRRPSVLATGFLHRLVSRLRGHIGQPEGSLFTFGVLACALILKITFSVTQ